MVNFSQISMCFKYDVFIGSIPTETASSTGLRFPLLFRTYNTGRPEFLTIRTKVSTSIAPPYVPPLWKPVPR